MNDRASSPPRTLLLGLVLLTLAVRVAAILWLRTHLGDAGAYEHDPIARSLVAGEGFRYAFFSDTPELSGHQAPAMPVLLALGYALFGVGAPMAKLFVQLVLAGLVSLGVGALGVVAWHWWGRRAMVVAMLGLAFYPAFVYMPTRIQAVNWAFAFLLLYLAGVVALREGRGSARLAVGTGLVAGLGVLGEPILAAPFGLCWLWLAWHERAAWRLPALLAGVAALSISPWLVRNAVVLGKAGFVKSSFWYVAWQGNHPGATGTDKLAVAPDVAAALAWRFAGGPETERLLDAARRQAVSVDVAITAADSAALRALPDERARMGWFGARLTRELREDPASYLRVVTRRAAMLAWFDPTNPRSFVAAYRIPYLLLATLGVLGLVALARDATRPAGWMLWWCAVGGLLLVHTLVITSARFRLPIEALLCLPTAFLLARVRPWRTTH
jgi:4-amino-4-deoxy-L-arabinose transferase-like glycosyltransferase